MAGVAMGIVAAGPRSERGNGLRRWTDAGRLIAMGENDCGLEMCTGDVVLSLIAGIPAWWKHRHRVGERQ